MWLALLESQVILQVHCWDWFVLTKATRESLKSPPQMPHPGCHVFAEDVASLWVMRMKTGVSYRKSLVVYFLMAYGRMLMSLHLLKRVCKAASAALWTLIQGSCRSAWSPEMERIAMSSDEESQGPSDAAQWGPHWGSVLPGAQNPCAHVWPK